MINNSLEIEVNKFHNQRYFLLEAKPIRNSRDEVQVRYFDSKTNEYLEKKDNIKHKVFSRELIQGHNADIPQILDDLKNLYKDMNFEVYKYSSNSLYASAEIEKESKIEKSNNLDQIFDEPDEKLSFLTKVEPEEINNYEDNQSYIIHAILDDKTQIGSLDYTIGKNKFLFITTPKKSYMARTRTYNDFDELNTAKNELETKIGILGLNPEEIQIKKEKKNKEYFLEITTTKKDLELLDANEFRILRYDSQNFKNKKEAETLKEQIDELEIQNQIGRVSLAEHTDKFLNTNYKVIVTGTNNKNLLKKLKEYNFEKSYDKNKLKTGKKIQERTTYQNDPDPFKQSSPTARLLNDFPVLTPYDPNKPLAMQINKNVVVHSYEEGLKESTLEITIDKAYEFYKQNTCSIDLEVTDWKNNIIPSGRVYMAILNSEKEKNLYVTKDAWVKQSWKKNLEKDLKKQYGNEVNIIFSEDEMELFAQLDNDSQKYMYIMGHNYKKYDQRHLTKYNDFKKLELQKNELLKKHIRIRNKNPKDERIKELNEELYEVYTLISNKQRVEEIKEQYGIKKSNRLWTRTDNETLDTEIYVKGSFNSIFGNRKLSTLAGFNKPENYDDLENKIKSGSYKDKYDVCKYTINDGIQTSILHQKLLRNAIIFSMLVNKPLSKVFSNSPSKLCYDAGDRAYEIQTNTYAKRHERQYARLRKKLENRLPLKEIFQDLVKGLQPKKGIGQGILKYPKIFLDPFNDLIKANTVANYMLNQANTLQDSLLQADLLSRQEGFLRVMVNKVKVYMEEKNLEFGRHHRPDKIYDFRNAKSIEEAQVIFHQKKPKEIQSNITQANLFQEEKESEIKKEILKETEYYLSDAQFAQASKIFGIEYNANKLSVGSPHELKTSMIVPNKSSQIAAKLKELRQAKIYGHTGEYLISKENNNALGISLGDIKIISTGERKPGIIGFLKDYENNQRIFTQGMKIPKSEEFLELMKEVVENQDMTLEEYRKKYAKFYRKYLDDEREINRHAKITKAIFGDKLKDNHKPILIT